MGVYDCYGKVQIKMGNRVLKQYNIGDTADIPDGVYVGWEGVVVVKDGIFIAEFSEITTKWGEKLYPNSFLHEIYPCDKK